MNRRKFLSIVTSTVLLGTMSIANDTIDRKNSFNINMHGDLDDDLIILRVTPNDCQITDIHQMHNNKGVFAYYNSVYEIEHNPGFIKFNKNFTFNEDEIYCVCLCNEREDAGYPIQKRFRTHYKNEKLFFNNQVFLPDLMPEYNSVPNYPLWFGESENPVVDRKDINGDIYNYYNLFENTTVQFGIVLPEKGKIKVSLFNQLYELAYSYDEVVTKNVKNLKSNELKNSKLQSHPFTELNNILNTSIDSPIKNKDYIETAIIEYKNKIYNICLPYPIMYPNLLFAVSNN